jgi:DNA mismatch repair protein MutL
VDAPRRPIQVLPDVLASQIAAGEVVERPASVVKELTENALDAGATRILVELEQGGIELVRISDNGGGIPPEELPLALEPHATSKVRTPDELERIETLGFRGEALASIASVSRLSIRSRTPAHAGASIIESEGGTIRPVRPAPGPVGTTLEVRTLFFNTPARRKFLRTVTTEQSKCVDVIRDLAISHPAVAFTLVCDGRTVLDVPPDQSPRDRALAVIGPELEREFLEVSADQYDDNRGVALWGLVGRPSVARATRASQHIFVRGRAVRDRTIQHAIQEAFRGLIEPSRFPAAVLLIEMSPQAVDVNVHPQKAEVRFRDSGVVHSVVYHAIKRALQAADLTPAIAPTVTPLGGSLPPDPRAVLPEPKTAGPIEGAARYVDYFARQIPAQTGGAFSYEAIREALGAQDVASIAASTPLPPPAQSAGAAPADSERHAAPGAMLPQALPAQRHIQVHNSYVVTQDAQGVVIVDQHALHERVMFEGLLARVSRGDLESQSLLTPVVIESTPAQADRLDSLAPLFARLGVEAEPMGPRSIGVRAFPTFLFERGVDPKEFMADLLERAESDAFNPTTEETLRDVLDMMACKAAVKAGDRLDETQVRALLDLREEVERSSNCPHGRPTSIRLTIRELEKLFGRS